MKRLFFIVMFTILAAVSPVSTSNGEVKPQEFLSAPSTCHAQAFKEDIFAEPVQIPLEIRAAQSSIRETWKYDILCLGDTVDISQDTFSNGGNIIIFADTVNISAKLDTRLYRSYKFSSFFLPQPSSPSTYGRYWPLGFRGGQNSFQHLTHKDNESSYGTVKLLSAYSEYYRCVDCRKDAGGNDLIPRMPDGATPPFAGNWSSPTDGIPPPSVDVLDQDTLRSGNIVVIARKINVVSAARSKLTASGLDGGIGGLGEPHRCTGWPRQSGRHTFSCLSGNIRSRSAAGGPGGPAGSIYFYSPENPLSAAVTPKINVDGGRGASSDIFLHPPVDGDLDAIYTGRFADFVKSSTSPKQPDGLSGKVEWIRTDRSDLLQTLIDLINIQSSFRRYEIEELVNRAYYSQEPVYETFRKQIEAFVNAELRKRMIQYNAQIIPFITAQEFSPMPVSARALCAKFDDYPSGQLGMLLAMYGRTCTSDGGVKPLADYLRSIGGTFFQAPPALGTEMRLEQVYAASILTEQDLSQIQKQLSEINQTENEILDQVGRARLDSDRRAVQHAIEAQRAQSRGQGNFEKLAKVAIAVYSGGAAAGALYEGLETVTATGTVKDGKRVPYTPDDRAKQWRDVKKSGNEFFRQYNDIRDAWEEFKASPSSNGAVSSAAALRQIERETRSFAAAIADERQRIAGERYAFTRKIFLARNKYADFQRGSIARFPDLLKVVITDYIADPSRDISNVRDNTNALATYIREFPASQALLRLTPRRDECRIVREVGHGAWMRRKEDCIGMAASPDENLVVMGLLRGDGGREVEVPLYYVAKGSSRFIGQLYSVERYAVVREGESAMGMGSSLLRNLLIVLGLTAVAAVCWFLWYRRRRWAGNVRSANMTNRDP